MMDRDVIALHKQLKGSVESRTAYQNWLKDPMTKLVMEIVQTKGRAQLCTPIDGYVAAQAIGHAAGWANALTAIQLLDVGEGEDVPADYADANNKEV